jgi:microcompartment protein CcmL/EutN
MVSAIGMIELSSIASGMLVADTMLKAGNVELLLSRSICSGKYMVLVGGEVAGVKAAVEAGREAAQHALIDDFLIPNVHEQVIPAIRGMTDVKATDALGILESFSVASLVEGADAAIKAANVTFIEIRLAMALGGKAFVTMTGTVEDVNAALDAGAQVISQKGLLVNRVCIPRPREEVYREII